jgi:hypothetical protein
MFNKDGQFKKKIEYYLNLLVLLLVIKPWKILIFSFCPLLVWKTIFPIVVCGNDLEPGLKILQLTNLQLPNISQWSFRSNTIEFPLLVLWIMLFADVPHIKHWTLHPASFNTTNLNLHSIQWYFHSLFLDF